eukprot:tig00001038_g6526.t1
MGELLELPSELLTRVLELLGARDAWRARGTSRAVRAAVDGIAWNELEVHYNIPGDPDGLYKFVWIMDSTTRLVAGGKLRLAPSATVGLVGNLTVTDDGRESVQLASSARRLLHAWSAACPAPGLRKVRAGLALRLLGHAARSPGPAAMLHSVTVSVLDGLFPAADREERTTALSSLKLDVVFPDAGPHGWAVSASDGAVLRALLAPHEALRSLRLPGAAVLDRRALEFLAAACPRLRRLRCSLAGEAALAGAARLPLNELLVCACEGPHGAGLAALAAGPPAAPSASSPLRALRARRRRRRRGRPAGRRAARPARPRAGPARPRRPPSLEHIHGWLHVRRPRAPPRRPSRGEAAWQLGHLTGIGEGTSGRWPPASPPTLLALRLYSDDQARPARARPPRRLLLQRPAQVLWLTAALRECRWPLERLDLCLRPPRPTPAFLPAVRPTRRRQTGYSWSAGRPPAVRSGGPLRPRRRRRARFPFSFSLYSQRPLEPPCSPPSPPSPAPRRRADHRRAPADAAAAAGPRAALEALASESRPVRIRLFEPPRV